VRHGDAGATYVADGGPHAAHGAYAEAPSTAQVRAQVVAEALASGQPMRYRDLVREQLHAWRERVAGVAVGNAGAAGDAHPVPRPAADTGGGHVLGMAEMLSVTALLQGDDAEPFARALAGEGERPL